MQKLDDLVKSLTDDPKIIRNIRENAAKALKNKITESVEEITSTDKKITVKRIYVSEVDFYHFVQKAYEKKYPEILEKIPRLYKRLKARFVQQFRRDIRIVRGDETPSELELLDRYYELQEKCSELERQLKKANEKLASYRRQGRPPSKQNPTENK